MDTNTSGTLYFDDFESRRFSYIGTLADPGVNDPQATNPAGWFARTYTYSTTIPHAVTNVTPETGSPDTYSYDANGNMTCRVEGGITYSQAYNAENRISSIAKRTGNCTTGTILESWSFAYDGDGVRVMTAHFTGTSGTPDSTTSYFMGGGYEVKDGTTKKYYSIAGMMVAMNDGSGLQYLLTDHLGSTVAVTNSSGTLTSQQRYLPFGAPRTIPNSPILGTDFTYTGQRKLDDGMGGIMDYRARFYSPALGRFLQPDTIIPDQFNPQSWNRFSYVTNRPVYFNDPSGHNHLCGVLIPEEDCQDESPTSPSDDGGGEGDGGDDDIITDPGDEDDSCTPTNCEVDCSDPAWGCVTHVEGTSADLAVYASFTLACLATGACLAAGASALNAGYEALVLRCLMSVVCRALTGAGGVGTQLTPNQIGQQGVQQAGQILPINTGQYPIRNPITGQLRIYDGQFVNGGYVEIKTSLRGITYATQFVRNQIAVDANMSAKPTWIFVSSNPSNPLMQLLNNAGIPWHVLHP